MNLKLLTFLALGASFPANVLAQEVEGLVVKDKKVNGVEKDTTDLYRKDEKVYKNIGGQEYKYNTFTSGSTNVH